MPTKVIPNISGKCINTLTRDYFRREKLLSFLALLLFKDTSMEFCHFFFFLVFMKMLH